MTDKSKLNPETTLFATDEEIVALMVMVGIPEKYAKAGLQELDRNSTSGFPRKQALWGGRRSWPQVREFLARHQSRPQVKESA